MKVGGYYRTQRRLSLSQRSSPGSNTPPPCSQVVSGRKQVSGVSSDILSNIVLLVT